jgi:hypothetical protein
MFLHEELLQAVWPVPSLRRHKRTVQSVEKNTFRSDKKSEGNLGHQVIFRIKQYS